MAGKMNARLILVPNRHDARVGRRSELMLWEETRETFSRYGLVTPKINSRADMERFCTLSDLDGQLEVTQAAFDTIFKDIFGHIEANQSNFFNSSTSGSASRNFSGISSLRRYVATPIGLA